jgi:hypothetical protein
VRELAHTQQLRDVRRVEELHVPHVEDGVPDARRRSAAGLQLVGGVLVEVGEQAHVLRERRIVVEFRDLD